MEIPRRAVFAGLSVLALTTLVGCESRATTPATPTPKATPTVLPPTPTVEALNPNILKAAEARVHDLREYPLSLRQSIRNFWINGAEAVEYVSTARNKKYLLSFTAAKSDPNILDQSKTTIKVERRNLSTGTNNPVFLFEGLYNPKVEDSRLPVAVSTQLQSINFDHQVLNSIAVFNSIIVVAEGLGLDYSYPSQPVPDERTRSLQLSRYFPYILPLGDIVAEINDYISTYSLWDKDAQGNILYFKENATSPILPVTQGVAFRDGGLTYIVDSTIGSSIREIRTLEELASRYPRVTDIPNSQRFLAAVEANRVSDQN